MNSSSRRDDEADPREQPGWLHPLIGTSPPFVRMMTVIDQIAGSSAPVLLVGESGTGKGLLARTIHQRSPRHAHPFVTIHCGASPGMFGSELFGYEKGAFTDAAVSKAGVFERADGGTLFLDEIAELEPSLQPMLVLALQRGIFRRRGGAKPVRTDVRIVSATNQDLAGMCQEKRFRNDLYSELSVITVPVPSLHERGGEDIRLLALYFLKLAASKNNRHVNGFTDEAMRALAMYSWPGNEQELNHVVERALILMSSGELITPSDLPPELHRADKPPHPA